MSFRCDVVSEPDALRDAVADWDALAVDASMPYCAPAWQLAWWRHVAPSDAQLRVVLARDGERLVGVAPFYASRIAPGAWSYGLLGEGFAFPTEPLARTESLAPVASAFVEALASVRPRPDLVRFDGVRAGSPLLSLLRSGWNGRQARLECRDTVVAPYVTLTGDDFDQWLATRTAHFRGHMRRDRRAFEKQGAVFRTSATPEQVDRDVAQLLRLHDARWSWRGGSTALQPGVAEMLAEAGRALVEQRRFGVVSIEVDGEAVAALLFVSAGTEVAYWNGGFDARWKRHSPSHVALLEEVRSALAAGYARLDLGPGAQSYKYRLADGEHAIAAAVLVPPGPRHLLGRGLLVPSRARRAVGRRLTAEQKRRLRSFGR